MKYSYLFKLQKIPFLTQASINVHENNRKKLYQFLYVIIYNYKTHDHCIVKLRCLIIVIIIN